MFNAINKKNYIDVKKTFSSGSVRLFPRLKHDFTRKVRYIRQHNSSILFYEKYLKFRQQIGGDQTLSARKHSLLLT